MFAHAERLDIIVCDGDAAVLPGARMATEMLPHMPSLENGRARVVL